MKEKDPEERLKFIAWERSKNEPSLRPRSFLWKWETDRLGCFRLKFSHSGSYLAAACTMLDSWTYIKIFHVESGQHIASLKGHHDLIHDFSWSADDNVLLSASADGSVKVWNLLKWDADIPNKFGHNSNDDVFFITNLFHPSYVYACTFF